MALYRWSSAYLQNYAPGQIVVAADSPEAARDIARAGFRAHQRERYSWMFDEDGTPFEWEEDTIKDHLRDFEADIAAEPDVIDGALFIAGSE